MVERRTTRDRAGGIPLQKRWGQHHLIAGAACAPVIEFLQPKDRLVAEVGPGGGVLTEQLVAAGASVVALEVDPAWGFSLLDNNRLAATRVVLADALEIDWGRFPDGTLVAGNLPFNVATLLIDRVLTNWNRIPRAAFMVQREVGDRLLAGPGSRAYGALSVLTAARARVVRLGLVRRGSFRPPPKVDGVLIGLELHRPPLEPEEMDAFAATVRLAFGQRRKQIRNALEAGWGREWVDRVLAMTDIAPRSRAEALSLEDFVRLHRAYSSSSGPDARPAG